MKTLEALEQKLDYSFHDKRLLLTALTHSSYANEHHSASNERLEFVGDSVLGMITAEYLYQTCPDLPEGKMTKLRAELVCEHSLWEVAEKLSLGQYLRLGRGEELSGGRQRHSILADCVEALIAAIFLDGGMVPCKELIHTHILSKLKNDKAALVRDWKTELQELIQQRPGRTLSYEMIAESGPDHLKRFTAAVIMDGVQIGTGEGNTKKEAEQMAARTAMEMLFPL